MSKIKYTVDPACMNPWIDRVGKLILNFSVIELESIHWFVHLAEREFEIKSIVEIPFASRVTHVMRHIEDRKVNDKWRKKALGRWNAALKLAHLRNQVAHNPLAYSWAKEPEVGDPLIIGFPNMRARRGSKAEWLLSTDRADKSINSMVEIAQALADLRVEWCAARDQGNVSPVKVSPSLWYRARRRISMAFYFLKARRSA